MSYRFTSNNAVSGNSAAQYLKHLYDFMTASSPTGPGWVSVGESNGTVGGMGTTGIILSSSDLTSANAWYVIERPDGGAQFLFFRSSTGVSYIGQQYSKGALFTGGSSTTLPTATDAISWAAGGIAVTGYFDAVADDAAPYSFVHWGHVASTIAITKGGAYIGLNTWEPMDSDPYVNHFSNSYTFFAYSTFIGVAQLPNCFAWDPSGKVIGDVPLLGIGKLTTATYPNSPPEDVNGNPVLIDSVFSQGTEQSSPTFYKGTSKFIRWADTSLANGTRRFGGAFIKIQDFWIPWNDTALL